MIESLINSYTHYKTTVIKKLQYGGRDISSTYIREEIEKGNLEELLNFVPVEKGDTFFIPSKTIHAICEGLLIAEIQQNCDRTYRVYDYGRRDAQGNKEALGVAMGHHPTSGKGRSFVNGKQPNNNKRDMEFSSVERAGQGLGFASQFGAVSYFLDKEIAADQPFVMMITGWNEWIAGCFHSDTAQNMAGTTAKFSYVDQFNCEFSRDGEPMRNQDGYGIGDNYYYQMVDYIRQYKGIAATPTADHQTSLNIYDLSAWDSIEMTYMDSVYDIEHRNTVSYDADFRYINNTGRNDIEYAKVSQDSGNLYFLVKTTHDLIIDNDTEWMNLYLNVDGDITTGWEGYDFVINRKGTKNRATVEKYVRTLEEGSFTWEQIGTAELRTSGDTLTIAIPRALIGMEGKLDFEFKWSDNMQEATVMDFYANGDTAPIGRFNYLYRE